MIKFNSERGNLGWDIIFFFLNLSCELYLRNLCKKKKMLAEKTGLTNRRRRQIRVFLPKFYINQKSLIVMERELVFHGM